MTIDVFGAPIVADLLHVNGHCEGFSGAFGDA
jgi:hypothetical protein